MSEMVERMKLAMDAANVKRCGVFLPDEMLEPMARAAIAAMHEPTREMVDAAARYDPGVINNEYTDALTHWQAMITEASK